MLGLDTQATVAPSPTQPPVVPEKVLCEPPRRFDELEGGDPLLVVVVVVLEVVVLEVVDDVVVDGLDTAPVEVVDPEM